MAECEGHDWNIRGRTQSPVDLMLILRAVSPSRSNSLNLPEGALIPETSSDVGELREKRLSDRLTFAMRDRVTMCGQTNVPMHALESNVFLAGDSSAVAKAKRSVTSLISGGYSVTFLFWTLSLLSGMAFVIFAAVLVTLASDGVLDWLLTLAIAWPIGNLYSWLFSRSRIVNDHDTRPTMGRYLLPLVVLLFMGYSASVLVNGDDFPLVVRAVAIGCALASLNTTVMWIIAAAVRRGGRDRAAQLLDARVLLILSWLRHVAAMHGSDWGSVLCRRRVAVGLEELRRVVARDLTGRMNAGRDKTVSGKAARGLSGCLLPAVQEGDETSRSDFISAVDNVMYDVARGNWLAYVNKIDKSRSPRLTLRGQVRPWLVALLPILLVLVVQPLRILTDPTTEILFLASFLWLTFQALRRLSPGLSQDLGAFEKFKGLFK